MTFEEKTCAADMVLTAAIEDYSLRTNQDMGYVRDKMIESGAYDALYDFGTGLWSQGSDYFISFYTDKVKETQGR